MTAQLEMFPNHKPETRIVLEQLKIKLDKIQRGQQGLFKRWGELNNEIEFTLFQIEEIAHNDIYGENK